MAEKLYRWVKASERLPEEDGLYIIKDYEINYEKIGQMYYSGKSPTRWHYVNPKLQKTNNVIANRNYITEWLEEIKVATPSNEEGKEDANEYREMLTQILLQIEYGEKGIPIEKRVAHIFNQHPNVIIGHNPTTKSVGIQHVPQSPSPEPPTSLQGLIGEEIKPFEYVTTAGDLPGVSVEEMPVLGNCKKILSSVPMFILNDEWAQKNHNQSLKRLKERGGLSLDEISAIIEKRKWKEELYQQSLAIIVNALSQYASSLVTQRDETIRELRENNDVMGKILMERDGEIESLKNEIARIVHISEQPGGYHP